MNMNMLKLLYLKEHHMAKKTITKPKTKKKPKILTVDHFDEKYTPDESVLSEVMDPESQLGMFETYGKDINHVVKVANKHPKRVWTAIDGDDGYLWYVAGYRLVNRVYYIITNEEWDNEDESYRLS